MHVYIQVLALSDTHGLYESCIRYYRGIVGLSAIRVLWGIIKVLQGFCRSLM